MVKAKLIYKITKQYKNIAYHKYYHLQYVYTIYWSSINNSMKALITITYPPCDTYSLKQCYNLFGRYNEKIKL